MGYIALYFVRNLDKVEQTISGTSGVSGTNGINELIVGKIFANFLCMDPERG